MTDPRVTAEGMVPFHEIVRRLRAATLCAKCGKTQSVINVATRGFRPERVTPETHCLCEGSPALQWLRPQGGVA